MELTFSLDTQFNTDFFHGQRNDSPPIPKGIEEILMDSLAAIRDQRMDVALRRMETLIETHPEFRLAQLIYGDLLLSKSRPITSVGNYPDAPPDKILGLREEARQRFKHHRYFPSSAALPEYLVRLPEESGRVVVVDIGKSRLYLYESRGREIRLRGNYYVSVGKNGFPKRSKGDKKTPIGVYVTTDSIPPNTLPDRYGLGAFPLDYPNEWDRRFGRTGDGIWIHGVPKDTYSRTPRASNGCVAVANADLLSMKDALATPNTPVILARDVSWIEQEEMILRRDRFERRFNRWRRNWENSDHVGYAEYYSRDFRNETENRESWLLRQKQFADARDRKIEIGVSNLGIFGYPDEHKMLVVTFDQDYRSGSFKVRGKKSQYWRQEKDRQGKGDIWRIVYENTPHPIQ